MSGSHDTPRPPNASAIPDGLHPRSLIARLIQIAVVITLMVIAIDALPGFDEVGARLQGAAPMWVVALALAEIGSCIGYLLVFRSIFRKCRGDLAMTSRWQNKPRTRCYPPVAPAASRSASGPATDGHARWADRPMYCRVLRRHERGELLRAGAGRSRGLRWDPGWKRFALLTLVPALIAALIALLVCVTPQLVDGLERRAAPGEREGWRGRLARVQRHSLRTTADGVDQAIAQLRSHSFAVMVGSLAYMACDIAALGCGFAAVGNVPLFSTLVLAYLIGQLGNLIPLPGGVGGTEGTLIGTLAIFGVNLTDAAAAVLVYRLFQLLVPAFLGAPAFVMLRRKLIGADQPALVCEPLTVGGTRFPLANETLGRPAGTNTVNLGCEDGDAVLGGPGWLGPIAVFGALHGPVGHFAFDDAWVLARFALG